MGIGGRIPTLNATLLILSALIWPCFGKNSTFFCREEERDALLELKGSFTWGTPDLLRSWEGKEDCCQWKGVGCDPKSGHVIKLELLPLSTDPSLALVSKPFYATELSPSLLKLRSLSHLDLSGFWLLEDHSTFPEFLGSMKQLRYLNLSNIYFSGSYHHLGNLTSLEVLDLKRPFGFEFELTTDGGDAQWISHLAGLKYLDMSRLFISSHNVMQVLGTFPSLSYLSLSSCGLDNSQLPYARGSNTSFFPTLSHLDLSGNYFEGAIPSMFQNMSSLSYLDLAGNRFHSFGVPSWWSSKLQHLDMSNNDFQGQLPSALQNMTSLSYLDLARNRFNSFKSPLWSSPKLKYLDMAGNDFQGQLPIVLQNMTSLPSLILANNHFSSVPPWFVNLKSLVHLDLSGNSFETFEGGFMFLVREKCELSFLSIDSSQFQGEMTRGNSTWFCASKLESFSASDNQFQGELPDWLRNVPSLTKLDISSNQLCGSIPEGLGQLRSLQVLRLQGNRLNGTIPHSLGQLQDLRILDLSGNSLEGPVSEVHFANLSKLEYLNLGNNHLVIQVASDWNPPFQLSEIDMGSCQFGTRLPQWLRTQGSASYWNFSDANIVGELPYWIGGDLALNYDWVITRDLSHNKISGPIPNFRVSTGGAFDLSYNRISGPMPNFSALTGALHLSYNQISGPIPSFTAFTGYLNLSHNQISGPLPNFTALEGSLDLSHNQISGPLPNFTALEGSLDLSHNQISGPLPNFSALTGSLDLSYNQISGPIPNFTASVESLHLSHNQITGPLPNLSTFSWSLDLSYNIISGPFPSNIGNSGPERLFLNDNLITGSIPTSLCHLPYLTELDLSRNKLSGTVPDCWGNGNTSLLFMDLSSNNLSGVIPNSFGNASWFLSLHLSGNNFHGDLPTALQNSSSLGVLDVGGNNLDGDIPTWIGRDLQLLRILKLRDNRFKGSIPSELCLLPELQVLDIAVNNLEGRIPDCFGTMRGMIQGTSPDVHNSSVHERMVEVMKGRDLEYTTNLKFVVDLDLSNNYLVGSIPESLTRLAGLLGLNLSHNCLSGEIPEKIGKMKFLESLDLSSNQLSGKIPPSISDLSMLSHLNLSSNNLSGRIPRGNQLDTLYEPGSSVYAGNPLLCGDPLPEKCPGEEVRATPDAKASSKGEDGDGSESVEKVIFYGVTATGFLTGFWGVFGVLVFKKKWRTAYFRFAEERADRIYEAVMLKVDQLKRRMRST